MARVNDQIITRTEYERAREQMMEQARQENVPQADAEDKLHDLLRDMIDQQLLLSKGKELGITGDAETMRRLDDIRKQNHLDSMEALQKAAEQQGISFEDFKQQIRNQVISNQVVQDEVGRHLNLTRAQEEAYYKAHGKDFEVPEQVHLSEILIPTPDNATDAQVAAAQQKADEVEAKLKGGANFADTAKANSGGPTASAGGDLGDFKRGALGDVLEKATFSLPAGGYTRADPDAPGLCDSAGGQPPAGRNSAAGPGRAAGAGGDLLHPVAAGAARLPDQGARRRLHRHQAGLCRYGREPSADEAGVYGLRSAAAEEEDGEEAARRAGEGREGAGRPGCGARERSREDGGQGRGESARRPQSSAPPKKQKIHREKIRYGQAPEKALPTGTAQTAETGNNASRWDRRPVRRWLLLSRRPR